MDDVLLFDVNETLLDLGAFDPLFAEWFGDETHRRLWFGEMLRLAFLTTITGSYESFSTLAGVALKTLGVRNGVVLPDSAGEDLAEVMTNLPPHPDVIPALEMLKSAGLRLATLTNSTETVARAQLRSAGLTDYFEQTLSADSVQRLKPAAEPYRMAAERLDTPIGQIRMIAAHDWDITGALSAGCKATFISRPGQFLLVPGIEPELTFPTILDFAEHVVGQVDAESQL